MIRADLPEDYCRCVVETALMALRRRGTGARRAARVQAEKPVPDGLPRSGLNRYPIRRAPLSGARHFCARRPALTPGRQT